MLSLTVNGPGWHGEPTCPPHRLSLASAALGGGGLRPLWQRGSLEAGSEVRTLSTGTSGSPGRDAQSSGAFHPDRWRSQGDRTCTRPAGTRASLQRKAQPLGAEKSSSAKCFQAVGGKCLGARLPASDFPGSLGEPGVSGTRLSQRAQKGPAGIYLITTNSCSTWAAVRLVLTALGGPPASGEAGLSRPHGALGALVLRA